MTSPAETAFTAIGIDVGGTKIAAGLASFPDGQRLARRVTPTDASRGGAAVLADTVRLARELVAEAKSNGGTVRAIGVGVCELVDLHGQISSANCIDWQRQPVREQLEALAPVAIEADVRAAALAESLFGAGQPFRTLLYVTVGTGISCCLMVDGKPYIGARGFTGTMASSPLALPCDSCGHLNQPTLEDIASGPALVARFNAAQGNARNAQEVLAAAAQGNAVALQIVRTASQALASQIGLLINVLDPEAVVIGGGLGLSEGLYGEPLSALTRKHIWSALHRDLPILRASTGTDAGWLGAAANAWKSSPTSLSQELPSTLRIDPQAFH